MSVICEFGKFIPPGGTGVTSTNKTELTQRKEHRAKRARQWSCEQQYE